MICRHRGISDLHCILEWRLLRCRRGKPWVWARYRYAGRFACRCIPLRRILHLCTFRVCTIPFEFFHRRDMSRRRCFGHIAFDRLRAIYCQFGKMVDWDSAYRRICNWRCRGFFLVHCIRLGFSGNRGMNCRRRICNWRCRGFFLVHCIRLEFSGNRGMNCRRRICNWRCREFFLVPRNRLVFSGILLAFGERHKRNCRCLTPYSQIDSCLPFCRSCLRHIRASQMQRWRRPEKRVCNDFS